MTIRIRAAAAFLATAALAPANAFAWGHTGHVTVSRLAIQNLPAEVPAFLRTAQAAQEIGELGAEADVSKGTGLVNPLNATYPRIRTFGTVHDFERDNGHFIDFDDSGDGVSNPGKVLGLVSLTINTSGTLPGFVPFSRRDYDTALRQAGTSITDHTQYDGYLAHNMVDHWQQVRKDFALYRAFTAAIANPSTPAADKAYFQYQLGLRKTLTLRDIGYWSHFVGDASQPMHISIHYNGWDPNTTGYPNPNGYTLAPIHGPFEGAFVKRNITPALVQAKIGAYTDCGCIIEQRVLNYLAKSVAKIGPVYEVEKLDPLFAGSNATQIDFAADRLAFGATEMRDEIVDAWRQSDTITVGFPSIKVTDIENGTILLTASRFAGD